MALNLGPDTTRIVGYDDYTPDIELKDGILYVPDNKVNKRLMVKIDRSKNSCLYDMCSTFKEMRKPYKLGKTKEDKSKSDALKIMVNTFYGANANPYIAYGDMAVGITITAMARFLILSASISSVADMEKMLWYMYIQMGLILMLMWMSSGL